MTFLSEIVREKKLAVKELKAKLPVQELRGRIDEVEKRPFVRTFSERFPKDVKIIAEIKKASPSKGILCPDLDIGSLAGVYEGGGASAISVITEEKYFLGSLDSIKEVRRTTGLPILRKDFIVDEYEIYQSKAIGADAVLLIGEALDRHQMVEFLQIAQWIGLDVLFEVHSMGTYEKIADLNGYLLGINNRNLETLKVDLSISLDMIGHLPVGYPVVVESGIEGRNDIERFMETGVSGFLVGTSLVLSEDPAAKLRELRGRA